MPSEELSSDFLENCIGKWGLWQFITIGSIFLSKIPTAFHCLNIVFLIAPVKTTCKNGADICSKECDEFVFDRSVFENTLVTEFRLYCKWKVFGSLAQSITMLGIFIGNLLFGIWSDKHGRKWPIIWAFLLSAFTGIASAFSPWYWLFLLFRFFCSVCIGGTMNTSFVMVMEMIGMKYRPVVGIIYQVPFSLGHALLALIAYFERRWRWYVFWQSATTLLFISYWCILPEAPRWLLSTGQEEKLINTLEKAAKINHKVVENVRPYVQEVIKPEIEKIRKEMGNYSSFFHSRIIVILTICISFNWFSCAAVFYGISQYLGNVSGNIFLNVAITGLMEIPGELLALFSIERHGRKKTLIGANIISTISIIVLALITNYSFTKSIEVVFAIVSTSTTMMAFSVCYVYAAELFPTVLRNTGVGFCSMAGRMGAILSPFIIETGHFYVWIPYTIFSILTVTGSVLAIFLPETKGNPLFDTIEEVEEGILK